MTVLKSDPDAPEVHPAPSETSAQGPVPKPGEPVEPEVHLPPDNIDEEGPPIGEGGGGDIIEGQAKKPAAPAKGTAPLRKV